MRRLLGIALSLASLTCFVSGQQNTPVVPAQPADAKPESVKVYDVGPGVTAPELLPLNQVINNSEKCKKKLEGVSVIPVIVEETGMPAKLPDITSRDTDMDKLARIVVAADQFKPGIHDGQPVAVRQFVEVDMKVCIVESKDDTGKKTYQLHLRSKPVQESVKFSVPPAELAFVSRDGSAQVSDGIPSSLSRVGGRVTAPVPLSTSEAEFSDEARRAKYQGICLISLTVDAQGLPQHLQVVRPLAYNLTEKAIEAVSKYRFKPAMKDGQPVPVMITIEVNFHLY